MSIPEKLRAICEEIERDDLVGGTQRDHFVATERHHFWRYAEMLDVLKDVKGARVLSVGIGYGIPEIYLSRYAGCQVFGTEQGNFLLKWPASAIKRGIDVRQCELGKTNLPFSDGEFDLVIFAEVLEHMRYSPHGALLEIRRVLKDRGVLLLTTPNATSIQTIWHMLKGRNVFPPFRDPALPDQNGSAGHLTDGWMHLREWTLDEVSALVNESGFAIKEAWHGHCSNLLRQVRVTSIGSILGWGLAKTFPRLRAALYVLAEKEV